MRQACSILTRAILENIPFSTAHYDKIADNQCHKITQSSAIKVLLRHLERRYITTGINNYADFTNGKSFISEKFSYLLKPLIDFSIEGVCKDKPSEQPFVQGL